MKIRVRFALALGCVLAAFGVSVAMMQRTHRAEAEKILESVIEERSELLDRILSLTGQPLRSFSSDFAQRNDLVTVLRTRDAATARLSLEVGLANAGAQAAWVFDGQGRMIYAVTDPRDAVLTPPPVDDPGFWERLRRGRDLHFYQGTPRGLVEVRAAPILSADDIRREGTPQGWLIVERLWDSRHLAQLADALEAAVWLGPRKDVPDDDAISRVMLSRTFNNWRGEPVDTLQMEYLSRPLERLQEGNLEEATLLWLYGIISLVVIGTSLTFWVLRPVHRLAESLEVGSAVPLVRLRQRPDEFGHLARQVAHSFVQRDDLRQKEESLRQSLELRGRLARDLHDGIIQSIYAAGLGLESARNLIAIDPAGAGEKIAASRKVLNDTLWQVRSFIDALEPEAPAATRSIVESLAALAQAMRSMQPVDIDTQLDASLAAQIGPHQELHLLQIAREALSNALRHAGAHRVIILLERISAEHVQLVILDDGAGFDPVKRTGKGRGLGNIQSRTAEIGGKLRVDSTAGKGTRISVEFSPKL